MEVLRIEVEVLQGHRFIQEAPHFLAAAFVAAGLGDGATEHVFMSTYNLIITVYSYINLLITKPLFCNFGISIMQAIAHIWDFSPKSRSISE